MSGRLDAGAVLAVAGRRPWAVRADAIDQGQARGEVAKRGTNQHDEDVHTADMLGLDRRRVAEWRETRDAGPAVVERGRVADSARPLAKR